MEHRGDTMRMYQRIIILLILMVVTAVALILVKPENTDALSNPQSIVYDATNQVYYVSNSGSGSIVTMDADGNFQPFVTEGLNQPRGLIMPPAGVNLWVVEPKRISAIDLMNKSVAFRIDLPAAKNLTDIAADENGTLYVTDTGGDCLWIVNPSTREKTSISDPRMSKPTGIVYDRPRYQMLFVTATEFSPIFVYDIRTQAIDIYMDTLYGDLRGIAIDPETGAIYFSSLMQRMIVEITLAKNRPEPFFKDLEGAGDLFYDANLKVMRVPLIYKNSIKSITLRQDTPS